MINNIIRSVGENGGRRRFGERFRTDVGVISQPSEPNQSSTVLYASEFHSLRRSIDGVDVQVARSDGDRTGHIRIRLRLDVIAVGGRADPPILGATARQHTRLLYVRRRHRRHLHATHSR